MPDPATFQQQIAGQAFQRIERRGKYILCHLDAFALIIHLKMTGRLYVAPAQTTYGADRWVHFRFDLDNGAQLRFSDSRKFGRVYLTPVPADVVGSLGPEPLEDAFTPGVFQERIADRRGRLKSLLLDQEFVAGIGNIYADEALFRAGLHPLRTADSLTGDEQRRLYEGIREALQTGIDREGASINWYRKPDGSQGDAQKHFFVYGRTGLPCPRCGTSIVRARIGGRSTHFCPTCQAR